MAPVPPGLANRSGALFDRTDFRKEASDFFTHESAITTGSYTVCLNSSAAAPPPQGVGVDMEESGDFPDRQQFISMFSISHIFSDLLFD
jgi:hypothetical protein